MIHKQKRLGATVDGQTVTGGLSFPVNAVLTSTQVNVGRGGDDTFVCKVEGVVRFERKGRGKNSFVYPIAK